MNYINIGCTPTEEDCFPVNHPKSYAECLIYKRQLKREFPKGTFRVMAFPHDFGTYYEVVALCGGGEEDEAAYAAECDSPERWDAEARRDLKLIKELA